MDKEFWRALSGCASLFQSHQKCTHTLSLPHISASFSLSHSCDRRLVDMLKENKDLISFHPGSTKNGNVILARIEVHNRAQVEQKILPRYFNHNSFASLRRQLNYFCFTRLGKGRQKGAAYCNEGVIVMEDILKLKRRLHAVTAGADTTGSTPGPPCAVAPPSSTTFSTPEPSTFGKKHQRSVSISSDESFSNNTSSESERETELLRPLKKKPRLLLSTMDSLHHLEQDDDSSSVGVGTMAQYYRRHRNPKIFVDLTSPPTTTEQHYKTRNRRWTVPPVTASWVRHFPMSSPSSTATGDEDVLAGCHALLSFSRGPSPGGLVV